MLSYDGFGTKSNLYGQTNVHSILPLMHIQQDSCARNLPYQSTQKPRTFSSQLRRTHRDYFLRVPSKRNRTNMLFLKRSVENDTFVFLLDVVFQRLHNFLRFFFVLRPQRAHQ